MATQAQRRAQTRTKLLDAARLEFTESGYAGSSVSAILRRAGCSRGAMYHHFASKEELFASIFVQTSTRAIRRATSGVADDTRPFEALVSGCLGWLEVVSDPVIGRLLFTDGPVALGWERCQILEEATSLGVMRASVKAAVDAQEAHVRSIETTARLINALLAEAALANMASPAGRAQTVADVETMIRGLMATTK